MTYLYLTKQPLVKQIFKDDYDRKVWGIFGEKTPPRQNKHMGVDYGANVGEKAYALENGEVMYVASRNTALEIDYGLFVAYYVPSWDVTIQYAHGNKILVSKGQQVSKGQLIFETGNTGLTGGPHIDVTIACGKHTSLQSTYNNAFDFETFVPNASGLIAENDTYVITEDEGMKLRGTPFIRNDNVIGGIKKGSEFNYTHKIASDGYMWVYDGKSYVARRKLDNTEKFGYIKSEGQSNQNAVKPTPAPQPKKSKLILIGNDLQGNQEVELYNADGVSYGKGNGITVARGQTKEYELIHEVRDGFYEIRVPNANPQNVYVKWRPGITWS